MKFDNLSITFHTDKIKECVDFYSKYLQAKVAFDAGWYVMIRLESDNAVPINLCFQGASNEDIVEDTFCGGVTLNLLVSNVDACWEQLKKTDIIFMEEITNHEWGDRAFRVNDPIGNRLYIYSERPLDDKYKDAVKE